MNIEHLLNIARDLSDRVPVRGLRTAVRVTKNLVCSADAPEKPFETTFYNVGFTWHIEGEHDPSISIMSEMQRRPQQALYSALLALDEAYRNYALNVLYKHESPIYDRNHLMQAIEQLMEAAEGLAA